MPADNELELYIVNDGDIYRNHTRPLYQRLILQKMIGKYDRPRALAGFMAIVNEGARRYRKEFGGPGFTAKDKADACREMIRYFETEYDLGNMKLDPPKQTRPSPQVKEDVNSILSGLDRALGGRTRR